jgi:hypothetical protein
MFKKLYELGLILFIARVMKSLGIQLEQTIKKNATHELKTILR